MRKNIKVMTRGINGKPGATLFALTGAGARLCFFCACILLSVSTGCRKGPDQDSKKEPARLSAAEASSQGEQIISRYIALEHSRDSAAKMRARILESDGATREINLTFYRKRQPDGGQVLLLEITAPPEERDRAGVITISPQGAVTATRYVQSNNSFVSTESATGEDSLFGMSLQELANGQPEKYDWRLIGEEEFESAPVYRVEGKLKQGMDSKFSRLVMLVSKENSASLVAEYYDTRNEMVRRITVDQMKMIDGYWTRMHWVVDNLARQKKVDFETLSVEYDRSLSDSVFTREHLKKIASK